MIFVKNKKFLDNYKLIILDVVHSYIEYLEIICQIILINSDAKEKHERKFEQVKKDFLNFLVKHKMFFNLSSFRTVSDDKSVVDSVFVNYHEGLDQFMKLEDFTQHTKNLEKILGTHPSTDLENSYDLVLINKEVIKVINKVLPPKKVIKNKFIKMIKEKLEHRK